MNCQYFHEKHCVSCNLLAYAYRETITLKEQKLKTLFPHHLDKMKQSVTSEQGAEGTRNKAKLAVAIMGNEIRFGFYNEHMQFKHLENCPLHASAINAVLDPIKEHLIKYKIIPYDLLSRKGELKYLLITYSESTHELLLRFILRSTESIPRLKKLAADLITIYPSVKVVTANIQSKHQAILEGDKEIVLTDNDCITHQFDNYCLYQGPRSFFQTNTAMALKLYQQFQTELSRLSIKSLLDLYCGVGAFSFFAEKHCAAVTGVEISDAAILYANKARQKNNSHNTRFIAMDVAHYLKQIQPGEFDAILVNPPRIGLKASVIHDVLRLNPSYIFYSSCNADTLQKDLTQLEAHYNIQSLQIFDMFPFTSHFETLVVLKESALP